MYTGIRIGVWSAIAVRLNGQRPFHRHLKVKGCSLRPWMMVFFLPYTMENKIHPFRIKFAKKTSTQQDVLPRFPHFLNPFQSVLSIENKKRMKYWTRIAPWHRLCLHIIQSGRSGGRIHHQLFFLSRPQGPFDRSQTDNKKERDKQKSACFHFQLKRIECKCLENRGRKASY